jgi:bacterioferritin
MGTRGREIIGMDVNELLGMLNRAYASEWLAYYQYWLGAKLIKGPITNPLKWFEQSPCKYDPPDDPYVAVLLDENIAGEQCAISVYKQLMDATKDKDMVTYNMALTILQQEVEHEEDLQGLREDLELMVQRGSR